MMRFVCTSCDTEEWGLGNPRQCNRCGAPMEKKSYGLDPAPYKSLEQQFADDVKRVLKIAEGFLKDSDERIN